MTRSLLITGLAAVLLAGAAMLPVEIPYTISSRGIVLPAQEWLLVRQADGSVGTLLRDNVEGSIRRSDLLRFERGDAVQYQLNPRLGWRRPVSAGDTILSIRSNDVERQMAALSGLLAAAESAVAVQATGEKEAVVERAERNLARAREEAELARREVERLRALAERQLVSRQDLETAETRVDVTEAEVAMAQAELNAVRSGAKQEELELARREMEGHRGELAAVLDRLGQLTIRSPISGLAVRSFGADTLVTIRDTSAAVVIVPVPWKEIRHISRGDSVHVRVPEAQAEAVGRVVQLGDTVHRLQREQVVMVTVLIEDLPRTPLAGALASCRIRAQPVHLAEYARRKIL